jgi:hypothetical protein
MDPRNAVEGYASNESPQRYRIAQVLRPQPYGTRYQLRGSTDPDYELGDVVERVTIVSLDPVSHTYFHSLQEADQLYADLCTRLIQEACQWFCDPAWTPLEGVADITMTDDQIREAIRTLDLGENKREADRVQKIRYVLSDLPWNRQRALIERLYALRREFRFEKLGPVSANTSPPRPAEAA